MGRSRPRVGPTVLEKSAAPRPVRASADCRREIVEKYREARCGKTVCCRSGPGDFRPPAQAARSRGGRGVSALPLSRSMLLLAGLRAQRSCELYGAGELSCAIEGCSWHFRWAAFKSQSTHRLSLQIGPVRSASGSRTWRCSTRRSMCPAEVPSDCVPLISMARAMLSARAGRLIRRTGRWPTSVECGMGSEIRVSRVRNRESRLRQHHPRGPKCRGRAAAAGHADANHIFPPFRHF